MVIIDLRGNSGGSELYAFDWIKNFTNQQYKSPGFSSQLLTKNSKNAFLFSIACNIFCLKKTPSMASLIRVDKGVFR